MPKGVYRREKKGNLVFVKRLCRLVWRDKPLVRFLTKKEKGGSGQVLIQVLPTGQVWEVYHYGGHWRIARVWDSESLTKTTSSTTQPSH